MEGVGFERKLYKCLNCGYEFSLGELRQLAEILGSHVARCPRCSYKIIAKLRDPKPKRIQAI